MTITQAEAVLSKLHALLKDWLPHNRQAALDECFAPVIAELSKPSPAEYRGVQWIGQPTTETGPTHDRTEWIAQFPDWVRNWQREHCDAIPLRMVGGDHVGVFTPYLSSGNRYAVIAKTSSAYGVTTHPTHGLMPDLFDDAPSTPTATCRCGGT